MLDYGQERIYNMLSCPTLDSVLEFARETVRKCEYPEAEWRVTSRDTNQARPDRALLLPHLAMSAFWNPSVRAEILPGNCSFA
jgi:hypothetical protein